MMHYSRKLPERGYVECEEWRRNLPCLQLTNSLGTFLPQIPYQAKVYKIPSFNILCACSSYVRLITHQWEGGGERSRRGLRSRNM